MSTLDAFNSVVASLHDATLDDTRWPTASALIDEACGTRGNGLAVSGGSGDNARVYFAGIYRRGERRRDLERLYFDQYHARDERVPRLRLAPEGRLMHVPDLYSDDELRASPAYNEGARSLGSRNGLNVRFDGSDGLRVVWAAADPVAPGGWRSPQLELIERLLPHIRQFVRVRQTLDNADAIGAGLAGLLDSGAIGVIYLDRHGRLAEANARALDILRRRDGLFDRAGSLRAWLPADDERLRKLLAGALPATCGDAPAGGSMTVRRTSGPTPLGLHVSPVCGGKADLGGCRVAALVLVVDPASRRRVDPVWIAAVLGLTPAEGRVSALLAEGRSVRDIATAFRYRESYVRWLLKQVYRKQDVSGQAPLVRLVLAADALPRR